MTLSFWGRWAFRLSCVIVALFTFRLLALPADMVMPVLTYYLPVLPVTIWLHVIFGPIALFLAPFQLADRLRARRPKLHRAMGYVYAVSILIAGGSSLDLLLEFAGSWFALSGFAVMGTLWIAFTALGIRAAMGRDFARHRRWMLRSVALTFGAVTLRIMMPPLMSAGWSAVETYDVTAWGCWLPSLLLLEWWQNRRRQPRAALA
jgi:uncharacterized membrane protein